MWGLEYPTDVTVAIVEETMNVLQYQRDGLAIAQSLRPNITADYIRLANLESTRSVDHATTWRGLMGGSTVHGRSSFMGGGQIGAHIFRDIVPKLLKSTGWDRIIPQTVIASWGPGYQPDIYHYQWYDKFIPEILTYITLDQLKALAFAAALVNLDDGVRWGKKHYGITSLPIAYIYHNIGPKGSTVDGLNKERAKHKQAKFVPLHIRKIEEWIIPIAKEANSK